MPPHNEKLGELSQLAKREAAQIAISRTCGSVQGLSELVFAIQTSDASLPVNGLFIWIRCF